MTSDLSQNPNVMVGRVADTPVLFNLEDRQLHSLNETAATCWDLLTDGHSADEVVGLVADAYRIEERKIDGEVRCVLDEFRSAGLCRDTTESLVGAARVTPRTMTVARRRTSSMIGPLLAFGVPIALRVEDVELRNELETVLAPLLAASPSWSSSDDESVVEVAIDIVVLHEGDRWTVSSNGQPAQSFVSRQLIVRHVVAALNSKPIDYLRSAVVFHAAAAEFDGGVTLFPGISNAGKSTLITQLVHRGRGYLSDEAVAVESGHEVLPFPKSISIDTGSQELLAPLTGVALSSATIDIDPRCVGPGRISAGGIAERIIFPEYRSMGPTVIQPLGVFDVFTRLLSNSFRFDSAGQVAFDTIVSLANSVPGYSLAHAGDVAHLELIDALSRVRQPVMANNRPADLVA